MQTLTTEARNRIFAEAEGWKIDNSFPDKNRVYRSPKNNIELDTTLKYHTSYDWIFSLIKVIEGMGGYYEDTPGYFHIETSDSKRSKTFEVSDYQSFPDPKLEAINCACLYFFENN